MNDIYLMNKDTGELVPAEKVFSEFYKNHTIFESVFDEWEETDIIVENTCIEKPDFKKCINI